MANPTYHLRETLNGHTWFITECWTNPRMELPAGSIGPDGTYSPGEVMPSGRVFDKVPALKLAKALGMSVREARAILC